MAEDSVLDRLKSAGIWDQALQESKRSGIDIGDMFSSQSPPAPAARRRFYLWLRDEKGYSLARIGRLVGRSHSTVIRAMEES